MSRTSRSWVTLVATGALLLGACTDDDDDDDDAAEPTETAEAGEASPEGEEGGGGAAGDTLAAVQEADVVRCGTRDDLPGFATVDAEGERRLRRRLCRVIAAAVLGGATKVGSSTSRPRTAFLRCSRGRSTSSCATRRGRRPATAPKA